MSDEPRFRTAYNATDGPITVDRAGRQIGGHEFGTIETASNGGHVEEGRLILIDHTDAEDTSPEAALAFAATDARNEGLTASEVAEEVTAGEVQAAEEAAADEAGDAGDAPDKQPAAKRRAPRS